MSELQTLISQKFSTPAVKKYQQELEKKPIQLFLKKIIDMLGAIALTLILSPIMLLIVVLIKIEDGGKAIFKQERVTTHGQLFYIYKFRTMVLNAEELGTQITVDNDPRITRLGRVLRKYRLDEFPQLFNILRGEMSFVGTRPEVAKYVSQYTDEMFATLLLPAGVTSLAAIEFKNEEQLLKASNNPDQTYVSEILPQKMHHNLNYLKEFSLLTDVRVVLRTVSTILDLPSKKLTKEI